MTDEETAAVPGLRERKKQATRRALEETAVRLFLDRGYSATTLDELVAQVGVSKRTFFRQYASKEEVALAAESELWDAYAAAVGTATLEGPVLEVLRTSLLAAVTGLDEDWDRRFVATRGLMARTPTLWDRSIVLSAAGQQRIVEELEQKVGVDSGNDIRLRLLGELAVGAWRSAARDWIAIRRRPATTGPRERLGVWRGPGGRAGLLRSIESAFDAIPASVTMTAARSRP